MARDHSDDGSPDLMGERAHRRLIENLRSGQLSAGQFVSMPVLTNLLEMPLAATRDAVKRAEAHGLVDILSKRGVMVMAADPAITRACMDLRALLDQEGARRLIAGGADMPLPGLRASHEALIADAEHEMTPDLPARAIATDLSLHDALAAGLDNPLAVEAYRINRDRIAIIQNTRPFLPDRIIPAMREHLDIIAAMERGDAAAATGAIRHHYRMTLRWWGILV